MFFFFASTTTLKCKPERKYTFERGRTHVSTDNCWITHTTILLAKAPQLLRIRLTMRMVPEGVVDAYIC